MAGGANLGDDDETISEINVTPFVDVMLVLLIIFMVTTNYMSTNAAMGGCRKPVAVRPVNKRRQACLVCNRQARSIVFRRQCD